MISPEPTPPPHPQADQLPAQGEPGTPSGGGGTRAFWTTPWRDGHAVEDERRDRNRVAVRTDDVDLRCSLGRIVDMSTRGLRLTRHRHLTPGGDIFSFTLRSGRDALTLRGACVWSRKSGFMHHTVGIAFAGMTPEETQLLRAFIDRHAAGPVLT